MTKQMLNVRKFVEKITFDIYHLIQLVDDPELQIVVIPWPVVIT